jgi:hypothetical protein
MSLFGRYCFGAIAALSINVLPLSAAEITTPINSRHLRGVVLEGEIVPGDYNKLRDLAEFDASLFEIYLASPGGSVLEAMKIGRLLRALRWWTTVPSPITNPYIEGGREAIFKKYELENPQSNYMCAGACFFIFIAGVHRESDMTDVDDNAILGIHRPTLTDSELRTISSDQAIAASNTVRDLVGDYLKEMNVPSKYADLMFSIPKDDIRWIDKASFQADFNGDIPELKDWLDARCDKRTDAEKAFDKATGDKMAKDLTVAERIIVDELHQKFKARLDCEWALRDKLHLEAWTKMFPSRESAETSWWWRLWQGMTGR